MTIEAFWMAFDERLKSNHGENGFHHLFFVDGVSALDAMKGNPPHILVTDMEMPGMRGSELLQRTHDQYPSIQTFILSGKCSKTEVDGLLQAGERILSKPLSAPHLVRILTSVDVSQSALKVTKNNFNLPDENALDPKPSFQVTSATYHRLDKPNRTTVVPFRLQIPTCAESIEHEEPQHTPPKEKYMYTPPLGASPHAISTRHNSLGHAWTNRTPERDDPVDVLSAARGLLIALTISILIWLALVFLFL